VRVPRRLPACNLLCELVSVVELVAERSSHLNALEPSLDRIPEIRGEPHLESGILALEKGLLGFGIGPPEKGVSVRESPEGVDHVAVPPRKSRANAKKSRLRGLRTVDSSTKSVKRRPMVC
jgi:hypothetical protein